MKISNCRLRRAVILADDYNNSMPPKLELYWRRRQVCDIRLYHRPLLFTLTADITHSHPEPFIPDGVIHHAEE